jgi:hypothetical protein
MSNILRRPMFRGGRVDSRGTGITSGLGYAGGGQIGGGTIYGNPMPDGRYGFATPNLPPNLRSNMAAILAEQAKATPTGSSLFQSALSKVKSIPYAGRILGPLLGSSFAPFGAAFGTGVGLGSLADFYSQATSTPEAYVERKKEYSMDPFAGSETDLIVDEEGNTTTRRGEIEKRIEELNVGDKPGFFPRGGYDKYLADRGIDPATGRKPEPVVLATGDGKIGRAHV